MKAKDIAVNAVIAAVYAALTIAISPLSYGAVQFRFTEILIFLAFYNKRYIPGLILGCALANLASPTAAYDVPFGTLATAIAVIGIWLAGRALKKTLPGLACGAVIGAVVNGLIVGFELHLAYEIPFLINALYVAAGEFAVLVIGIFIFLILEKNTVIRKYLRGEY